jgi:hypothetical protein
MKYYILTVCRFSFDVTISVVSVELSMNVKIAIVQNPFNMANARFVIRESFRFVLIILSQHRQKLGGLNMDKLITMVYQNLL